MSDTALAEAPNIAQFMASQGVLTTEDTNPETIPDIKIPAAEVAPEGKTETATPPIESTPAATTTPAATASAPPAQQQQTAAPASDWREEAKKAGIPETLKALGFDDKTNGLVNTFLSGGDITSYLKAASTDYSKMPAEEVMRHHLREEFPELSAEDFDLLFQNRVMEKYQLDKDLFDDRQRKVGQVLLNADANKIRAQMTSKQQEFILNAKPPAPPGPTGPTPEEKAAEVQKTQNWFKGEIAKDPLAAGMIANKKLTIGEGDEAFHFEIKTPDELLETIANQQKMMEKVFDKRTENGEVRYYPNATKQLLIGLIAEHGMDFLKEYGKHMRALGSGKALEPIENASQPTGTPTTSAQPVLSPAEAMARGGVVSGG